MIVVWDIFLFALFWKNLCVLGKLMYPYGTSAGDIRTCPKDDSFTGPIHVAEGIRFFGKHYNDVYVNSNPVLSLGRPFKVYKPKPFPLQTKLVNEDDYSPPTNSCSSSSNYTASLGVDHHALIALYWADADPVANQPTASVYYRLSRDTALLTSISDLIASVFLGSAFNANWAIVLTYDRVTYYDQTIPKDPDAETITLQAVLTSDGRETFVIYNYEDVNWPNSRSTDSTIALVGVDAGDKVHYCQLPESLHANITKLEVLSNVGINGTFILPVHKPGYLFHDCMLNYTSEVISTETPTTEHITTEASTTEFITTEIPTTEYLTTETFTTEYITTAKATTEELTTEVLTTEYMTTVEDVPTHHYISLDTASTVTTTHVTISAPINIKTQRFCPQFPTWLNIRTNALSISRGDMIKYACKAGYKFDEKMRRKYTWCSPRGHEGEWYPEFTQCNEIINKSKSAEFAKPVEAASSMFIGSVAIGISFFEIIFLVIIDIPNWISVIAYWVRYCKYLSRRNQTTKMDMAKRKYSTPYYIKSEGASIKYRDEYL